MIRNRRTLKVTTAPSVTPITLDEAKAFLRVDGTADDTLITSLIGAAVDMAQKHTRRYFITHSLLLTIDILEPVYRAYMPMPPVGPSPWPYNDESYLELPARPVVAVQSIVTVNTDNTETTYSASNYGVDTEGGRVYLYDGKQWPSEMRAYQAVKVAYTAGYGTTAADVPAAIKTALLMYVAQMYECRGGCDMSEMCKSMLAPYTIYDLKGWS